MAAVAVAAGLGLFYWLRVATGGTELAAAGDTVLYYYPQYAAAGAALREGRLPLWNPWQLVGHPWLATLQGGLLYPFHVVYAWLPTWQGMAVSSALHLAIAALGMAALARRLRLSRPAALLGAVLLVTQGRLPGHAAVPNLLEAGAWLAPGAVAVAALARGALRGPVAALGGVLALSLLAGYPQYTVYCCYAWAALLALLLYADRMPLRQWGRPILGFAVAVGLGVLVASPQLLASLELLPLSTRAGGPDTLTQMFPMGWPTGSWWASLQLLAAGQPTPSPFGLTALALAPLAFLARDRRLAWGLIALLVLVFGMALGPASPLFELYRWLPGVGSFRLPTQRLMLVVTFLFFLVTAIGLDALLERIGARFGARPAAGVGAALLAVALLEPFLVDGPRPELPYTGRGYEQIYERRQGFLDDVTSDDARVMLWNPGIPPKLPSKLGEVFGVRVLDDYEPLSLQRQSEYFGYLRRGRVHDPKAPPFFGRLVLPVLPDDVEAWASRARLVDLAAVRWVLATNEQRHDASLHAFAEAMGYRREPEREALWEVSPVRYVNDRALPRAYATYRTLPAPPTEELMPRLASPDFDPLHASYVEDGPILGREAPAARRGHPVRIVRSEGTEVELSVSLVDEGLVVLADTVYPGWEATVDGEPTDILATNHLFRGVRVPAGEHVVRFRYAPAWGAPALAASLLGLGGVAALLASYRREGGAAREG